MVVVLDIVGSGTQLFKYPCFAEGTCLSPLVPTCRHMSLFVPPCLANVPRCPWARARLALPASAGFPAARMWLRCQFVTGCLRLLFAGGCLPCVRGRARARRGVWLLGVTCRRLWPLVACCGYLRLPVATCSCLWPRVVACGRLRLLAAGWRLALGGCGCVRQLG